MNLLKGTFAFFLPTLIVFSAFAKDVSLTKSDFSAAKETRNGSDILVMADLSASGDSKMKTLNQHVGQEVDLNVGGETHHFKLRDAIKGHQMQMGPFTAEAAKKVVDEINGQK